MQKNVGNTDAIIRITGGLLGLAYGIGKMSRRPYNAPWLLMTMSAMKVAEGVTRFCPMLAAMRVNTRTENGMQNIMDKVKNTGMQAVMKQMTNSMDIADITGLHQSTDTSAGTPTGEQTADKTSEAKLSSSDQQLEAAVQEFVAEKTESQTPDEYRYPTYS